MNKYLMKKYCLNKDDIRTASNNVISILERKKKVIIAHDDGKRRNKILGNTIKYILNKAYNKGVNKPIVICINYANDKTYKSKSVVYTSDYHIIDMASNNSIITKDEEVVAIILEHFDMLGEEITESDNLLNFINKAKSIWNIMYEVIVMNDLFSNPILTPFVTFRMIDNKFLKIMGIEGSNHLADLFYDMSGKTMPRDSAFVIHKKIAEFTDMDLYNYVDENNLIIPEIEKHKSAESEVLETLHKIKEIDKKDELDGRQKKMKNHIILCNNADMFIDRYRDIIVDYAKSYYTDIRKIVVCRTLNLFNKRDLSEEYNECNKRKNTTIYIMTKKNFILEPWHNVKDNIRSISFLSVTDNKDKFPMSLKDFMQAYYIAYSFDNNYKNKIFVHYRGDFISYDNYIEMKLSLVKDFPYKFNKNILISFYNNYIKLGTLDKTASKTVALKKTA